MRFRAAFLEVPLCFHCLTNKQGISGGSNMFPGDPENTAGQTFRCGRSRLTERPPGLELMKITVIERNDFLRLDFMRAFRSGQSARFDPFAERS